MAGLKVIQKNLNNVKKGLGLNFNSILKKKVAYN